MRYKVTRFLRHFCPFMEIWNLPDALFVWQEGYLYKTKALCVVTVRVMLCAVIVTANTALFLRSLLAATGSAFRYSGHVHALY